LFSLLIPALQPAAASAQDTVDEDYIILGVKVRAGGRYDNVRMCVGSPAGVKGGPAMDVSFYAEFGISEQMSIAVDLPVMRPILFGAAFEMLQFEPDVSLLFRRQNESGIDLVAGPTLGISLHYGPDYQSERSGSSRGESFFALGPRVGGYFGLDFKRPDETFNFQLGVHPYVTPLFSVSDPEDHRGVVVGGTLDGLFRFTAAP
jgi:hypothetical protein